MFTKNGIILKSKDLNWGNKKLWVPTAYKLSEECIIIYFAGQNKNNESDLGYFILNIKTNKVVFKTKKPILRRGKIGSFDDSAVVPSQILKYKNKFYLYYVGWMQGKKVPYLPSLGLAISKKLTGPFKKISKGPILEKSIIDPYFVSSCYVEKTIKNNLKMHYTSCVNWEKKNKKIFPKYLLKNCYSSDGINWRRNGNISINFKNLKETAITRPWVINHKKNKYMFFSSKVSQYKIEVAKFKKNYWKRQNKKIFFNNPNFDFDNKSNEYASVVKLDNKFYMFYNGNNYGKEGVALAICKLNDFR